jgi:hypothetical protein
MSPRDVKMADVDRKVLGLGRAAEHVNHFETLAQLDEVAEVLERARSTAASRVHDVRRA